MRRVTSLFARRVVEEIEGPADKDALLATLGLERGGPVDPAHMIEDSEYYDFLERVAAVDADPTTIPLRAGAAMRCDDYGAFGLAWKSATTLRGSFDRVPVRVRRGRDARDPRARRQGIAGVIVPTGTVNVPLNNRLQRLEVDVVPADQLSAARRAFEARWNLWNRIRGVLACLSAALMTGLLVST